MPRNIPSRNTLPMKPPPQPRGPSILDSVKSGFGIGIGMDAARTAISGVFGASETIPTPPDQNNTCSFEKQQVFDCLREQDMTSTNTCQDMLNHYQQCRKMTNRDS
jgi:hypothetical protein